MLPDIAELKKARKRHSLTQARLAKLAGVSQSLIAKMETGRIDASYSKVRKIFETIEGLEQEDVLKGADVSVKRIITVQRKTPVSETIRKMRLHNISQLPVMEGESVVGVVAEADIIGKVAEGADISGMHAEDVMEEAPPILPANTPVPVIASLLQHAPLVLLSEKGKLKGLVTKADILSSVYKR